MSTMVSLGTNTTSVDITMISTSQLKWIGMAWGRVPCLVEMSWCCSLFSLPCLLSLSHSKVVHWSMERFWKALWLSNGNWEWLLSFWGAIVLDHWWMLGDSASPPPAHYQSPVPKTLNVFSASFHELLVVLIFSCFKQNVSCLALVVWQYLASSYQVLFALIVKTNRVYPAWITLYVTGNFSGVTSPELNDSRSSFSSGVLI